MHPGGQGRNVVRVGDVDDHRLDTRPTDCVGILAAPNAREDVEPAPREFAGRRRADAGRRSGDDGDLLNFS